MYIRVDMYICVRRYVCVYTHSKIQRMSFYHVLKDGSCHGSFIT